MRGSAPVFHHKCCSVQGYKEEEPFPLINVSVGTVLFCGKRLYGFNRLSPATVTSFEVLGSKYELPSVPG